MRVLVVASSIAMLAACSTPPKPPTVDGTERHSINSTPTAEAIALRAQLVQTEQRLREAQARPVYQGGPATVTPPPLPRSQTVSVHFPFNGTTLQISADETARLLPLLSSARRIEIRGRTDGEKATDGDEKVAMNRALAAKRYLIGQGISPAVISVNYVSAGDYIADNGSVLGKSKNRRVDIEVFNQ